MVRRQTTRCACAFARHVVASEPHRSHVTDVSMQRRLHRAFADRWSEDVDASLLRLFVEASSLCFRRRKAFLRQGTVVRRCDDRS
jgi:hypothetical protein